MKAKYLLSRTSRMKVHTGAPFFAIFLVRPLPARATPETYFRVSLHHSITENYLTQPSRLANIPRSNRKFFRLITVYGRTSILHSDWLTKRTDALFIFKLFSADG